MLKTSLLPQTCGYINGQWHASSVGGGFQVINPATGARLAKVPTMGVEETTSAIQAAERFVSRGSTLEQRRGWLLAIAEHMLKCKDDLGRLITLEHGKPLREGVAEAEYSAGFFKTCAAGLDHLQPRVLPEVIRGCRWTVHHRPAGVAALITPWNFPLAMLAKKLAAAIGAGCGVVAKPSSQTPLSAIATWTLAERAGVPAGMLNLVMGPSSLIGKVLCEHPAVRLISFTGSTEVGMKLMHAVAPYVKRLALELGGNAPFIVFEDADLNAAAEGLVANKFRAGGQTCVCTNRVYAHASVQDAFLEALIPRVRRLKVGNGIEADTDIGPLINKDAFEKVDTHVRDAVARGARLLTGGNAPQPRQEWGAFFPPTVLTGMKADMLVCREETFGPVIPISTFQEEAAVIAAANGTPYGLAAYVYTGDPRRAERVVGQLVFGHVGVNTGSGPTHEAPFGGMKQSGFGREGGVEGLLEFTETQVVASAMPA